MNLFEKTYSIFAVLTGPAIVIALFLSPQLQSVNRMLLVCSSGFAINVGLLFIVLKDIFSRPFPNTNHRYAWVAVILLCWPAIVYYLIRYGFQPRPPHVVFPAGK